MLVDRTHVWYLSWADENLSLDDSDCSRSSWQRFNTPPDALDVMLMVSVRNKYMSHPG